MRGLAQPLNVVVYQEFPCRVGERYLLTGFYRGDAPARASLCSHSGRGQYIFSPTLGPSEKWIPFAWRFTVENPETPLLAALRLGAVGSAFFDDVELKRR
jgi:hypothetical protein